MAVLVAIPVFITLTLLQAGIIARLPLLSGSVDLVLLTILAWSSQERVKSALEWALIGGIIASLATALPFGVLLISYLLSVGTSLYLKKIFWKARLLALLLATFCGTIITISLSSLTVFIRGVSIPLDYTLNSILIPSLLLNLIAAIPVYILLGDLANWIYPED